MLSNKISSELKIKNVSLVKLKKKSIRKLTGKGTFKFTTGDIYEGDFVDGKLTGKGTFKYACGDIYEGDFADFKIQLIMKITFNEMDYRKDYIYNNSTKNGNLEFKQCNENCFVKKCDGIMKNEVGVFKFYPKGNVNIDSLKIVDNKIVLVECTICMNNNAGYLNCKHIICEECYKRIDNKCPYCRQNVSSLIQFIEPINTNIIDIIKKI